MTEMTTQFIVSSKLLWLTVFAFLYGFGGMRYKAVRRYGGAAWLTLGVIGYSILANNFSYYYLIMFPLLVAALSIGYGKNSNLMGIFKTELPVRAIYGLALSVAAIPVGIVSGSVYLLILHVAVCTCITTVLGTYNIAKNSRAEETIIGVACGFIPLFMV